MPWASRDAAAPPGATAAAIQIALATFGILALELALIRWTAGQVRVFAYFNNLVLIAAFLGMGLGVALGKQRPWLLQLTLPVLLLLAALLAFAGPLGLVHMSFPEPSIFLWSAAEKSAAPLVHLAIFLGLVGMVIGVFVCAGAAVGAYFSRVPPLQAYAADLTGSLLGTGAMTLITLTGVGPALWLALGVAPFVALSRRWYGVLCAIAIVALGGYSGRGAQFSPYNRIDIVDSGVDAVLEVNRDFHQYLHDLSDAELAAGPADRQASRRFLRTVYDLPFVVGDARGTALVLGAGTGNDVQGALRSGFGAVWSVDIDPRIVAIGRARHPEQPYSDPRVRVVVDDARAFLEQYRGPPFDVICYGLLDSHAMFSSLSTLRLENYVYTEQGLRAAYDLLAPRGVLSVSYSVYAGPWIADRLYWTIALATGQRPLMIAHGLNYGATFLVARDPSALRLDRLPFAPSGPSAPLAAVHTTSDDWPFLYVRPGEFPWGYLVVLGCLLAIAGVATPAAFGRRALVRDFDLGLFLMGASFLLIEARGVTTLSLLFGSTWLVNSAIFAGVLVMVLLSNLAVLRWRLVRAGPWFVGLLAAVVLVWAVDYASLNALPLWARGTLGGLINALPVGFAGIIVSIRLARSHNATAALGSNLLGSVLGGCLEYLSMAVGLRALVLLALAFYLAALAIFLRSNRHD